MSKKDITKQLRDARSAIDAAISWIVAHTETVAESPSNYNSKKCLFCGKQISETEDEVRGVHRAPCYNMMQTMQRNGEKKISEWELEGKISPPKPPGRPKRTAVVKDSESFHELAKSKSTTKKAFPPSS